MNGAAAQAQQELHEHQLQAQAHQHPPHPEVGEWAAELHQSSLAPATPLALPRAATAKGRTHSSPGLPRPKRVRHLRQKSAVAESRRRRRHSRGDHMEGKTEGATEAAAISRMQEHSHRRGSPEQWRASTTEIELTLRRGPMRQGASTRSTWQQRPRPSKSRNSSRGHLRHRSRKPMRRRHAAATEDGDIGRPWRSTMRRAASLSTNRRLSSRSLRSSKPRQYGSLPRGPIRSPKRRDWGQQTCEQSLRRA